MYIVCIYVALFWFGYPVFKYLWIIIIIVIIIIIIIIIINNNNNLSGAIRIRYNIPLERLPPLCLCGDSFNLQHAFSCPNWGLVITRHKELRNLVFEILGEFCKNVVTELWIIG